MSYQDEDDRYRVELTRGGKAIEDIKSENITHIEETVKEWQDAPHIRQWFIRNVYKGRPVGQEVSVSPSELRDLLSVCDKVLSSSHLVPEAVYRGTEYDQDTLRREAERGPARVIKNISVAHKLLPLGENSRGYDGRYDEAYMETIEETRDWIIRMLAHPVNGTLLVRCGW